MCVQKMCVRVVWCVFLFNDGTVASAVEYVVTTGNKNGSGRSSIQMSETVERIREIM